jgi:hypothetical protein
MVAGQSGAEEGYGAVKPVICAAGGPTAEIACGVDPGTSVLEGSNVLANCAIDIGGEVGGGSGDKAGEVEDIIGAIAKGEGSSCIVVSAQGGQQLQLPEPCPPPSLALQTSLSRDVMARLSSPCHHLCCCHRPQGGRDSGSPWRLFAFTLRKCSNVCWVLAKLL